MCCAPAANGAICRRHTRPGRPCTDTGGPSSPPGCGTTCCTSCPRLQGVVSRLAILYADSGYAGPMVETACQALGGCQLITIAKDAAARGFHVLPKRWVVERTLAWLCRNRRLSKDYEHLPAVSEAFVKLAMIRLMIARLT